MRSIIILLFLLSFDKTAYSQHENGLVNWLTFAEAQEKNKTIQKPFLIDLYTDWCGWCKHMMKTTYSNQGLANYINANFYPVKFDAETKDTIEYNGKIYKPLSKDPRTPHELALKFLGNKLSYPSTVFATNNFEYNLLVQGYLEDKKIEPMLVFMVENAWQSALFDDFNKHFTQTFYDTNYVKVPVKVYSFSEIGKLQKKQPRKVLVNISADFCNTGKVQTKTTFSDTSVANYINKHFYLVNFNATGTDTILFQGEKYYNTLINTFPLHNLSLKLSANRFSLPTLCVLDEQLNTLDVLNFYISPERLKPVVSYFGSNSYKKEPFQKYMEDYMKPPSPGAKKSK